MTKKNTKAARTTLDAVALELRHLAYQIRVLKMAKAATEEI